MSRPKRLIRPCLAGAGAGARRTFPTLAAAMSAFALIVLAMVVLGGQVQQDDRWGWLSHATRPLAGIALLMCALVFAVLPDAAGLRQRAFLAPIFGWLIAIGLRAKRLHHVAGCPPPDGWSAGPRARYD